MTDDETRVTLQCDVCSRPVQRAIFERGQPWVHTDDEISLNNPTGIYDHPARVSILDVTTKEVTSE